MQNAPMSVLVDASVWVAHFRDPNTELVGLLAQDAVLMHPFVLAELACGTPPAPRARTLLHLSLLRPAHQASQQELLAFIEREALYGPGCGMVDLALLASARITPGARLWTLDKRLDELARHFGVA